VGDDDGVERDDDNEKETYSSVWEMKKSQKTVKQLHANMTHFGLQITIKALKEGEIIDKVNVYGLAIKYEKKAGTIHRLTINLNIPETFVEDFG